MHDDSRQPAPSASIPADECMRMLSQSMRDYALLTLDVGGNITAWNTGAERLFGRSAAEALGQPFSILFTPEDVAAGVPEHELAEARDAGRSEDDRWHLRRDGTRFFCSGITTPLLEGRTLRGYGKIARDLTGTKHAEADREAQLRHETSGRAKAQAASDMKDEFLAVVSHELKNPLNLIQLNAELLLRAPEARGLPIVTKAAETIRRTVLSQAQIIDDLLDVSRMNTGKLSLHRVPMDWAATVSTIAGALQDEAAHKKVSLAIQVPQSPVNIDADPVRIEQIVWNLLTNALKFTPAGGSIDVALCTHETHAELQVQDTGRGIVPEALPHIFDMFKQGEPRARRHGGMGIGLALVRSLAEAHGGRADARSPGLDEGSTFTVALPLIGHPPL